MIVYLKKGATGEISLEKFGWFSCKYKYTRLGLPAHVFHDEPQNAARMDTENISCWTSIRIYAVRCGNLVFIVYPVSTV